MTQGSSNDKISPSSDTSAQGSGKVTIGAGIEITPGGGGDEAAIDDVEFESYDEDTRIGARRPEDRIAKLREKLAQISGERQEYLDGWQRTKADFINYKKREEEEKAQFVRFAKEEIILDLLPTIESFDAAFANKEAWEKVDPAWRKGVEYIHTNLLQVLRDHALLEVDPTGETFNPELHTAIETVETNDPNEHYKILRVAQKGYSLHGKILRHPRVVVAVSPGEHLPKEGG